jgi:hypothetical protein
MDAGDVVHPVVFTVGGTASSAYIFPAIRIARLA